MYSNQLMRRIITVLAICLIVGYSAHAQANARITGNVYDQMNKGLSNVTVTLLQQKDSSLAKMAVTDKSGRFELVNIKEGQYLLAATYVGFEKKFSASFEIKNEGIIEIPAITMQEATKGLSGVTVQARRPLVENKIDKMVVNVDASPTNAGATALEVLEKSPGISVDRDGNISIKGKQGVIVLMDGKQTYLSGQDLANLLRNMPASQLDQIEIMTQPSAKFDASGNSGILNLRTKKSLSKGFNGSVNLSYVQGKYPKSPNSFSFNYRAGKVNIFSNLSYSYWTGFNDQHLSRTFRSGGIKQSVFEQQADQKNRSQNFSGRLGLDYTINKNTSIGFLVNGIYRPGRWENNGRADIYDGKGNLDSFVLANTINRDNWKNFGTNINFRRVLSPNGRELTADADMIQYKTNSRQTSDNYTYRADGTINETGSNPLLLRGNLPSDITIYSGKIDYVHPISKESKIEAGCKKQPCIYR
jgi:hypothetical protein